MRNCSQHRMVCFSSDYSSCQVQKYVSWVDLNKKQILNQRWGTKLCDQCVLKVKLKLRSVLMTHLMLYSSILFIFVLMIVLFTHQSPVALTCFYLRHTLAAAKQSDSFQCQWSRHDCHLLLCSLRENFSLSRSQCYKRPAGNGPERRCFIL